MVELFNSWNSSSKTLQLVDIGGRRLDEGFSYDATGFLQFATRTNVSERDWFIRLWLVVIVVIAIVLFFVVITALFSRWAAQRGNQFHSETSDSHKRSVSLRSVSRRLLGMCVVLTYLAILPLSMISLFEILRDASFTVFPHVASILAMLTLALIVGAIVGGVFVLHGKTESALSKWQTKVVWGVVYSNYVYSSRLFFAVSCFVQMLTGILIATVTKDALTQMVCVIVLHALYLVAMLVLQPFVCSVHLKFAIAFEILIMTV